MRQLAAALGILWAVLNAVVAAFFVVSAFTAETAKKEGIAAQGALLVGGILILIFGWLLAQQSWRLFQHRSSV